MADLYPLKLTAKASERLWGGSDLKTLIPSFKDVEHSDPIGEAWLVYAENEIENGALAGRTLQAVADDYGEALLGSKSTARYGTKVPLLAKYLDAAQALSTQVHPDDAYALEKEAATGHLGKVEAWYILKAKDDASIIWGFKDEMSHDDIRNAIKEGTLENHLNQVSVQEGDVIFNPAGTVHAVGAGILLFEIQQSSDLTYRLYDFNRKDSAGNLRELHVDKALEVSDLTPGENAKVAVKALSESKETLIASEHFVAEKWHIDEKETHTVSNASLELITVLDGSITINSGDASIVGQQSDSFVLPANVGKLSFSGSGTLIRCYLP